MLQQKVISFVTIKMMKISRLVIASILTNLFFYLPLVNRFFWSDDWYFLWVSRASNFQEFLNFFSLLPTAQSIPMYRPLSTQVLFFFGQHLFGLNALPYYLIILATAALSWWLLYKLMFKVTGKTFFATVIAIVYIFSASHFARLVYISAYQEVLMATLVFVILWWLIPKKANQIVSNSRLVAGLGFFGLALLSKESAVVLPFLLLILEWWRGEKLLHRRNLTKYGAVGLVTIIYLYLRLVVYGLDQVGQSDYVWNFSPFKAVHTAVWYGIWSVGMPEIFIHYVGSGFKILERYWSDFPKFANPLLFCLVGTGILFGINFLVQLREKVEKNKHLKFLKNLAVGVALDLAGLLPVIFLPDHKYVLGQSLALVGMAWLAAVLLQHQRKFLVWLTLAIYIIFNLTSIIFSYGTNVAVQRAATSQRLFNYLEANHPNLPADAYFYFYNDKPALVETWGVSKQIHQAVSDKNFFYVFYGSDQLKVDYEDFTARSDLEAENLIEIPTSEIVK